LPRQERKSPTTDGFGRNVDSAAQRRSGARRDDRVFGRRLAPRTLRLNLLRWALRPQPRAASVTALARSANAVASSTIRCTDAGVVNVGELFDRVGFGRLAMRRRDAAGRPARSCGPSAVHARRRKTCCGRQRGARGAAGGRPAPGSGAVVHLRLHREVVRHAVREDAVSDPSRRHA